MKKVVVVNKMNEDWKVGGRRYKRGESEIRWRRGIGGENGGSETRS